MEWRETEDSWGTWRTNGKVSLLIEPSKKYLEQNVEPEYKAPEPTQDDFMLDLEFRIVMLEVGL